MSDEDAIQAANAAFYRAFNEKDAAAMADAWAGDAPCSCIHPGWNLVTGRDAVVESWNTILANPGQPRIVVGGVTVVRTGETALVICREFVGGTPLIATNAFVREDGAWRIYHHQAGYVAQLENP